MLKALGDICEFKYGKNLPAKSRLAGETFVFGSNGEIGKHSEPLTNGQTIIIGRKGSIGEIHFSQNGCWPIDTTYYVDGSVSDVDLRWLFYTLRGLNLGGLNRAAAVPGLNRNDAYEKQLLVPDTIEEQRRIAAILDKADAIRRKREQALTLADDFLRSAFLEMFGDPLSNPKGWETSSLTDLLNFKTGKLDSNAAREDGKYPFFTCAKEDFWIDQYAFDCEALLLAGNNANADYSVKHYKGKFNAYQRTYVITPKQEGSSFRFFKHALQFQLNQLKRFSKGTNTKYLTMGIFRELAIPAPPLDQQQRFERVCKRAEQHINALELGKIQTDAMFASLSQRAFRGEL